ncbi:ectonucleotide pyrophosphatase/phosphodiesterase family member 5-like isoform X1 [Mya arenaria]|uniref:ectonucleotide pyrophosphatase/phosphodiesterase family member 5-like isoform X1 n=1 Tax=Mya arenaria TaxID=6604 RepID=UPI0022E4C929|nr:ectonucleotide pyrophosphatase/phosphodiesterase family member 5-like isoform X1 [Mya arenaria]
MMCIWMQSFCSHLKVLMLNFFILILFLKLPLHVDGRVSPHKVLLISFDGFRWDYYKKARNLTSFHRMIADGAFAKNGMINAFITKTFPNHYTLSTGLFEESHGIVGNQMYDSVFNETYHGNNDTITSNPKWYSGEPIWVTNQRQNTEYRSGCICWPESMAPIEGFRPYRIIPFRTQKEFPYKDRINTMIEWFTDEYPINLGLLYFEEPDKIAHQVGPDSPEVLSVLFQLEKVLDDLFWALKDANIYENTDIIVLSDHGMASIPPEESYKIELTKYLTEGTYFVTSTNPVCGIFPSTPGIKNVEAIVQNLSSLDHAKVYLKADLPEEFHIKHNRRTPPIMVIPEEHYWCSHNNTYFAGEHGYNNSIPDMHPVFLAMGPSFKPGSMVDSFNNVDVYPLLCRLLDLVPAPNNGSLKVVSQLLVDRLVTESPSTLGTYLFVVIVSCMVSGIFCVAACQVQRRYRRLHRRNLSPFLPLPLSSMGGYDHQNNEEASLGLLGATSDDEI